VAGRRGEQGLVALDWMLIFVGVVGAAVGASVLVQNLFEEAAYEREDPIVRVIEADIAAARIAAEAQRLFEKDRAECLADLTPPAYLCEPINVPNGEYSSDGYDSFKAHDFEMRCEGLEVSFDDVLDDAEWHDPKDPDGNDTDIDNVADDLDLDGNADDPDSGDHRPARCVLTPKENLVQ